MQDGRAVGKQLAWSWVQAAALVAFSAGVALAVNWARGPGGGGLPLVRRAPFDLYTDCPEIAEDLQSKKVSELKPGSRGVVYLDGRMAHEYCSGHLPGARFMPVYETEPLDRAELGKLRKLKGRWLVVYGNPKLMGGKRLATELINARLRGVYTLEGGLEAWKKAGRRLERCVPAEITIDRIPAAKEKIVFVDARERARFEAGHIPRAVLFTYDGILPPEAAAVAKLKSAGKVMFVVYGDAPKAIPKTAVDPSRAATDSTSTTADGTKADATSATAESTKGTAGTTSTTADATKTTGNMVPEEHVESQVDAAYGAASELKARGFYSVKVLGGGFAAWVAAGKPVEKGRPPAGKQQ